MLSSTSKGDMPFTAVQIIAVTVAILAIGMIFFYLFWRATTITIGDKEIIKQFSFIFKNKKTVPYVKIASVNVVRTLFDRLLGTATIRININSAVNPTVPEIAFVLKNDIANEVRNELSARIHGLNYESQIDQIYESVVKLTAKDSIMHGLFGHSTGYILMSLGNSLFGVFLFIFLGGLKEGIFELAITFLIVGLSMFIAVFAMIIRYFNFKVYRIGDTIYLHHGAIQLYKTSFKIGKINAVHIKRTLVARLLNKAVLEVEVVGVNATSDATPVLCILTSMENINKIISEVIPEFRYEAEGAPQPPAAAKAWLMRAVISTSLVGLVTIAITFGIVSLAKLDVETAIVAYLVAFVVIIVTAIISLTAAHVGYKACRLDIGESLFFFRFGIVDRSDYIIQYDRVQIADVFAWPVARHMGLARCGIRLLSAIGASRIKSGFYVVDDVERIQERVLQRIRDGTYDYRKY